MKIGKNLFCSNDMLEKFKLECQVDYEKAKSLEIIKVSNGML